MPHTHTNSMTIIGLFKVNSGMTFGYTVLHIHNPVLPSVRLVVHAVVILHGWIQEEEEGGGGICNLPRGEPLGFFGIDLTAA